MNEEDVGRPRDNARSAVRLLDFQTFDVQTSSSLFPEAPKSRNTEALSLLAFHPGTLPPLVVSIDGRKNLVVRIVVQDAGRAT